MSGNRNRWVRTDSMAITHAVPIVLVVLGVISAGFYLANMRGSVTLLFATVLLCIALIPPCINGWRRGRQGMTND